MPLSRWRAGYGAYIRLPRARFLVITLALLLGVAVLLGLFASIFSSGVRPSPSLSKNALSNQSLSGFLFFCVLAVVVAPFIETFVFQVVPHKIFKRLGVRTLWLCGMASTTLFALSHSGGPMRLVHIGILGCVYYFLYSERNRAGAPNPYVDISLLHSGRNAVAVGLLSLY